MDAEIAEGAQRPQREAGTVEGKIGERILGCALKVHRTLGPGLLESTYEACLAHELSKAGMQVRRQVTLPLAYDGLILDQGYRLDILVEERVVIEVKAVERDPGLHRAQVLTYLKLGGYSLGYALNFNSVLLRDGVIRVVNGL